MIGIGDAACSLIGGALYEQYALEYHVRFVKRIHELGALARLHICGDCGFVLPHLPEIGADIMDLDSMVSVAEARLYGARGRYSPATSTRCACSRKVPREQ